MRKRKGRGYIPLPFQFRDKEKLKLVNSLVTAGIDRKRIRTIPSGEFFDLDDTAAAHRITELRYRF